jgi:hypothetical protein
MRLIVAGALSVGFGACQGPDDSESVGVVRAALSDAGKFTTKHGAQVAGTESTDHINVAWTATDTSGKSQIVGEAFSNVTGDPFGTPPPPGSVIYSCPADIYNHCTSVNSNTKSFPAIAWEQPDTYTALLVWQEDVAGEAVHSKIMGVIIADDGSRRAGPTPFVIYDKAGEQAWKPWVTVVPTANGNRWLVTYTRRVPIGGGAYDAVLSTSLVDPRQLGVVFNGDVVGKGKGVNPAASRPTASFDSSKGVLYTWNDNRFVFTNGVSDLGYRSPVETVSGAAGIVGASNEDQHSYAVAYKKGTTVHARPFLNCTAQSCSPDETLFTTGNGVNAFTNPVISTYGANFGIVTGETLASGPGRLSIDIMDSSGNAIPVLDGVNDTCPAALKGTIGSPGTMAAFQKRADVDARVFFLYGTYCDQQHKIRASGRAADDFLDNLAFDVAD